MGDRGLQEGEYYLRNAADPSPLVGVDSNSYRVVTRGKYDLWIVRKAGDGRYTLVVEPANGGPSFYILSQDGNLVGEPNPPPTVWNIPGPEGGPYTIQVNRPVWPAVGWTVRDPSEDGSPVTLNTLPEDQPPPENQKWYFDPYRTE